jgi:lipoprotein-anchoring transpeptidase ErfK/SrfK
VGGSHHKLVRLGAFATACAALLLAPGTAANGEPGSVSWEAPTPAPGSVITAAAGVKLSLPLVASSAVPTASVTIKAAGRLPYGAKLASMPGNPAHAVLTWTPQGRDIGNRFLRFTAVDNLPVKLAAQTLSITANVTPSTIPLSGVGNVSRWAFVMRPTVVRSAPRSSAHAKARLSLWTPENYPNLVTTLQQRVDRNGTWVQVRLPILPNNSTGWVKRGALSSLKATADRLVVDRAATRLTLFRNGATIFSTRVGVGKSVWPTPHGEFYITEKMTGFHNAAYGPLAFGTNARSSVLTDWPGGGFIGIHGTNEPGLIPGHISHGCVRVRNAAILHLARLLRVGTPLTIR